jgi:hypothetical protein
LFRNQIISLGWRTEVDFFRSPKLTLSCSAEGKEGRILRIKLMDLKRMANQQFEQNTVGVLTKSSAPFI